MDLQLVIVLALVALSAAFLAYRIFGSLAPSAKSPGCSGCAISSSCAASGTVCAEQECNPAEAGSHGRRFVARSR